MQTGCLTAWTACPSRALKGGTKASKIDQTENSKPWDLPRWVSCQISGGNIVAEAARSIADGQAAVADDAAEAGVVARKLGEEDDRAEVRGHEEHEEDRRGDGIVLLRAAHGVVDAPHVASAVLVVGLADLRVAVQKAHVRLRHAEDGTLFLGLGLRLGGAQRHIAAPEACGGRGPGHEEEDLAQQRASQGCQDARQERRRATDRHGFAGALYGPRYQGDLQQNAVP